MINPKVDSKTDTVKARVGIIRAEMECWAQHQDEADSRTAAHYTFALGAPRSLEDLRCAPRGDEAASHAEKLDQLAKQIDSRIALDAEVPEQTPSLHEPWQARASHPRARHDGRCTHAPADDRARACLRCRTSCGAGTSRATDSPPSIMRGLPASRFPPVTRPRRACASRTLRDIEGRGFPRRCSLASSCR